MTVMKNNLSFIVQRNADIYTFIENLIRHSLSRVLFFTNITLTMKIIHSQKFNSYSEKQTKTRKIRIRYSVLYYFLQ